MIYNLSEKFLRVPRQFDALLWSTTPYLSVFCLIGLIRQMYVHLRRRFGRDCLESIRLPQNIGHWLVGRSLPLTIVEHSVNGKERKTFKALFVLAVMRLVFLLGWLASRLRARRQCTHARAVYRRPVVWSYLLTDAAFVFEALGAGHCSDSWISKQTNDLTLTFEIARWRRWWCNGNKSSS
jgi:hypothetical protein